MSQEQYDVLIAEDDKQISNLLAFFLTREGYSVNIANDGQQAVDAIARMVEPKIIVLDIMMPYYDGYELLDHIRNQVNWNNVPIVMLSAKSREEDIIQALEAGADEYIVKPFHPREFITRLKMLMRRAA